MIISQFPSGNQGAALPNFTYTGNYDAKFDAGGWKIRFLSSGTFTVMNNIVVDIFAVGGGGNGRHYFNTVRWKYGDKEEYDGYYYSYGAAGGGGYTATVKSYIMLPGSYDVIVGQSGEASLLLNGSTEVCKALAGSAASGDDGGDGGSGGGSQGFYRTFNNGNYSGGYKFRKGGTDGADGTSTSSLAEGGTGQGTTTSEFGEASGKLYAAGGTAYYDASDAVDIPANSGNGGHGGKGVNNNGASGIVIIRNARG